MAPEEPRPLWQLQSTIMADALPVQVDVRAAHSLGGLEARQKRPHRPVLPCPEEDHEHEAQRREGVHTSIGSRCTMEMLPVTPSQ